MRIDEAFSFSVIATGKLISLLNKDGDRTVEDLNEEILVLFDTNIKPPFVTYEIYIATLEAKYWRDVVNELAKTQKLKYPVKTKLNT